MTDPIAPRLQYWCMKCGAPATYLMTSMDPAYGIGLCQAGMKNHDRGLVTTDRDQVERQLAEIAKTKAKQRAERRAVGGFWNTRT